MKYLITLILLAVVGCSSSASDVDLQYKMNIMKALYPPGEADCKIEGKNVSCQRKGMNIQHTIGIEVEASQITDVSATSVVVDLKNMKLGDPIPSQPQIWIKLWTQKQWPNAAAGSQAGADWCHEVFVNSDKYCPKGWYVGGCYPGVEPVCYKEEEKK